MFYNTWNTPTLVRVHRKEEEAEKPFGALNSKQMHFILNKKLI